MWAFVPWKAKALMPLAEPFARSMGACCLWMDVPAPPGKDQKTAQRCQTSGKSGNHNGQAVLGMLLPQASEVLWMTPKIWSVGGGFIIMHQRWQISQAAHTSLAKRVLLR